MIIFFHLPYFVWMIISFHLPNASITSAIISLGHDLNMCVIAEGVEDEQQFNYLQALQCDEIQGYLFSKPIQAEEMEKFLSKGHVKI